MIHAENLVAEQINTMVKESAISALKDLKNSILRYTQAIERLKVDPEEKRAVLDKYRNLDSQYRFAIPAFFQVGHFEIQLLSAYVQATNLHLLHMRDAVMFGLAIVIKGVLRCVQENTGTYGLYLLLILLFAKLIWHRRWLYAL
ncbi:insecticidal delta-endotoxin Cry8Ea1 family protein [Bacillus paranthracis]|uniref:Crystaline entomocidal protoxin n=1 Tax=Bacillus paranthracis TaxID=2026186 RepID=A0AAJ1NEP5_9BACI|nr:insecticidal delta-endotoxin Cry8Ea1 family protein [Bacillus paranthracis]MDG0949896.1 insecticidal delta-endotoxin Cry8Ea1 family protein [Bacillus paranthracis]MDG0955681.1 insecticidal delta-endotoxin Cry8Ea1 family protein [Bacillus paranthracis]